MAKNTGIRYPGIPVLQKTYLYSRRVLVLTWRESRSLYWSSNISEKDHYGQGGLMVWVGIMSDGYIDLNVFDRGTLTGQRFRDEFLAPYDIQRLEWPEKIPDLNTIENVWDVLGHSIAARRPARTTIDELKSTLVQEWMWLPKGMIRTLVNSVKQQYESCQAIMPSFF
ncbi:transposable element Tcb2 transposase [Trichonephila clavipes]|nr:transposable element Tcb2 transposase [Trichonephila clavipes]